MGDHARSVLARIRCANAGARRRTAADTRANALTGSRARRRGADLSGLTSPGIVDELRSHPDWKVAVSGVPSDMGHLPVYVEDNTAWVPATWEWEWDSGRAPDVEWRSGLAYRPMFQRVSISEQAAAKRFVAQTEAVRDRAVANAPSTPEWGDFFERPAERPAPQRGMGPWADNPTFPDQTQPGYTQAHDLPAWAKEQSQPGGGGLWWLLLLFLV